MAFVKSVYYETELASAINLRPDQMLPGFDVAQTLLENLRADVEKKCNSNSYVVSVKNLTHYEHGMIDRNNSTGQAIYRVRYAAYICAPTQGQILTVKYSMKIPKILSASCDPIVALIDDEAISTTHFKVEHDSIYSLEQKRTIGVDDYLSIQVDRTEYIQGDNRIIIGAKLLKLASEKDIKEYKKQQTMLIKREMSEMSDVNEFI